MEIINELKTSIPEPVKTILRSVRNILMKKYSSELAFWKGRYKAEKGVFKNSQYRRLMLAMAQEHNDEFLRGKIVADFGCGPKVSLVWARSASLRIGIDVLADLYSDEFTENIISHGMIYLKCSEKVIPLPSEFVDVMFTLNAMDHVNSFSDMCSEIIRVLKPGGEFIGSFALEEPATPCEPQKLNEEIIRENLLNSFQVQSFRVTNQGPKGDEYAPFFQDHLHYDQGNKGFLWVRGKKKSA